MDKRAALCSALGAIFAGAALRASAQTTEMPSQKELAEVLSDDQKTKLMLDAVWLLRQILVFGLFPADQEKDRDIFARHVEVVDKHRKAIVDDIVKYEYNFPVQTRLLESLPKLIAALEKVGVIPNSQLALLLIKNYALFSQSLAIATANNASPNSICDTFPFDYVCG